MIYKSMILLRTLNFYKNTQRLLEKLNYLNI